MNEQLIFPTLLFAQLLLVVFSIGWFLFRNDEIPLFISGLIFYCTVYRYWSVTSGIGNWVNVSSQGLGRVTDEGALQALSYIMLGQVCLLATYMRRQKRVIPESTIISDSKLLDWLRPRIFILSAICLPLVGWTRATVEAEVQQGRSLALEVSGYFFLFPLALVGLSLLNVALWKSGGYTTQIHKLVAALIMVCVAFLTFSSSLRFQFMGWIIGSGIIISSTFARKKRLIILVASTVICLGAFAVAGSMRSLEQGQDIGSEAAWERFASAEDANMLDGFVLLEQVYPNILEYSMGGDHLEIILRPIPRALWPDKPVGGYVNRLGANDYSLGTTGISPTLFGSFYAEGGLWGIVLLSIIYGIVLAAASSYSVKLQPFASFIVRAVLCASLIPLLRGGDLAGIYAWIGMAFWPCFLLLWLKRAKFRLFMEPNPRLKISKRFQYHTS